MAKSEAEGATTAKPKKKARRETGGMPSKSLNRSLRAAKATKQDEFYTQLSDIEKELRHYTKYFKGKTILCNCDDPKVSNFFHHFSHNFEKLKLKKLITTCYKNCEADLFSKHTDERGIYLEYDGDKSGNRVPDPDEIGMHKFKGDGDFRSEECIKLLKQADIIVTNPPFSLFREYVDQLVEHKKKFLIIGSLSALTYRDTFKLIRDNQLWLGYGFANGNAYFGTPYAREFANGVYDAKTGLVKFRNVAWFTNMDIDKRHERLVLYKHFKGNESDYEEYDNYDAINVDRTKDIPDDYNGVMGVPITFLDKHSPDQFEIVGLIAGNIKGLAGIPSASGKDGPYINGKLRYGRILIRRKP